MIGLRTFCSTTVLLSCASALAQEQCATAVSDVESLLKSKLSVQVSHGLTFKEKDTDGRPLRFVFHYKSGFVQLEVLQSDGNQLGLYTIEICAIDRGIVVKAGSMKIGIEPDGQEHFRATGVPILGTLQFVRPTGASQ